MSYLEYQRGRMLVNGGNVRDNQISIAKRMINESFYASPSYYQVTINSSPTPLDVWIVDHSDTKEWKQLITKPDSSLNAGDIVFWDNSNWITLVTDNMGDIYTRGTIARCLESIKWQDEKGAIKEVSFYVNIDNMRTLGFSTGNYLITGNERRYITIPKNEDTKKLKKLQRFIFDNGVCWKIDSINTLINGLIELSLQESQIDTAKDNVELRVCDFVNHSYSINVDNGNNLSLTANSTLQLNTTVTDNGNPVSSPSLTYISSDNTIATVSSEGLITTNDIVGNVTITVALVSEPSVTSTISLNVVASVSDNYSLSIDGNSSLKVSQSTQYTSTLFNNGVVVTSQPIVWNISDTSLATITSQSNEGCTIQANSNNKLGTVTLQATIDSDNTLFTTKQIQIKGLF